jgi:hypothetical protein
MTSSSIEDFAAVAGAIAALFAIEFGRRLCSRLAFKPGSGTVCPCHCSQFLAMVFSGSDHSLYLCSLILILPKNEQHFD